MNLCTVSLLMASTAMLLGDTKACSITSDGCSVPLSLPFPYKKDFTPACIKHDVCYRCGIRYGWSRSECDVSFKRDMVSICETLFKDKKRSFWGKVRAAVKIGTQLAKWPFVFSKLDHCKHGADIYFTSVDAYGEDSFRKVPPQWCNDPCVISQGSPMLGLP